MIIKIEVNLSLSLIYNTCTFTPFSLSAYKNPQFYGSIVHYKMYLLFVACFMTPPDTILCLTISYKVLPNGVHYHIMLFDRFIRGQKPFMSVSSGVSKLLCECAFCFVFHVI